MLNHLPELTFRQKKILEIIIQEFVRTGEPVSSGAILSVAGMQCSSATIRNEMAKLEDMGYLMQPHSVSGRIPMDSAYRFFVNEIIKNRIEPPPRETADEIDREYRKIKSETESLIERTADMLSRMTSYTSMVLAPKIRRNLLKYVKLVPLEPGSVLLIMISSSGEIIHKVIQLQGEHDADSLEKLATALNRRLQGKPVEDAKGILSEEAAMLGESGIADGISGDSGVSMPTAREIVVSGKNKVFDYSDAGDIKTIKIMMELLEEEKAVAEILSKTLSGGDIDIIIGAENSVSEMKDCSLITAAYRINSMPAGRIGILGPKRMPYRQVISIITYTAENFGDKLSRME